MKNRNSKKLGGNKNKNKKISSTKAGSESKITKFWRKIKQNLQSFQFHPNFTIPSLNQCNLN
jgi:hypothetical protein